MPLINVPLLPGGSLTFPDPAGDARGDGTYVLPRRPGVTADALDLREFRAEPVGRTAMRFTVSLGRMDNPWGLPSGFSAGVTDIFVKTALGTQRSLDALGLNVRGPGGWQYHVRVMGTGATLRGLPEDQSGTVSAARTPERLAAPQVRVEGTALIIDAAIPPGVYGYWVTSSVYSPLSPDGLLRPGTAASETAVQAARAGSPVPVDVLATPDDTAAYTVGTLAPVGASRDTRTLLLVVVGGLGLLLTTVATIFVWRRRDL